MKWSNKGLIFRANNEFGWVKSHAQVPTVLAMPDQGVFRVYYSCRPEPNSSVVAMMDLDINSPTKIIKLYDKPVLEHGDAGLFDEHGAMPQFVCRENDIVFLFYAGWSRRESIPYSNWVGLATSSDGGITFKKYSNAPVLDRCPGEPLSATGLFAIKEGKTWHGFYATGTKWYDVNGNLESAYEICKTVSEDLINWTNRSGQALLPKKDKYEANTRPTVIKIEDTYHMWFCYRGVKDYRDGLESYRIGHAFSRDLIKWQRNDEDGVLPRSEEGFDSRMMAYPYVVENDGKYYMFYCGNGFGVGGFGYAILEL